MLAAPDVHDVVVTRRGDGEEVLRTPPDPFAPGDILAGVRAEPQELHAEAFLAGWTPGPGRGADLPVLPRGPVASRASRWPRRT